MEGHRPCNRWRTYWLFVSEADLHFQQLAVGITRVKLLAPGGGQESQELCSDEQAQEGLSAEVGQLGIQIHSSASGGFFEHVFGSE